MNIQILLSQIRVKHWIKNLLIFAPVFFAGKIHEPEGLLHNLLAFVSFSMVASALYILNDWRDLKEDRQHPIKKFRPMAAGKISLVQAFSIFSILLATGSITAFFLDNESRIIIGIYFFINLLYSIALKHIALLDIVIISSGFILRLLLGGASAGVDVSVWMVLITFLLTMMLGIGKRIEDVLALSEGKASRKSVDGYNMEFIWAGLVVLSSISAMSYISYTISDEIQTRIGSDHVYYTALPVIVGILRYIQILMVDKSDTNPTDILFRDRFLQGIIILWMISAGILIYKPFGITF